MELMFLNPRKRKARRANPSKRRRHHHHARARRRNPIFARVKHKARRHVSHRRRRNPISMKASGASAMIKNALLMGVGSVGVDAVMGQVRTYLPTSVQTGYEYSAVKALITVGIGVFGKKLLGAKAVTIAEGALAVQIASFVTALVPTSMSLGGRKRMLEYNVRGLGRFLPTGAGMVMNTGQPNWAGRAGYSQGSPIPGSTMVRGGVGAFLPNTRRREGVLVR